MDKVELSMKDCSRKDDFYVIEVGRLDVVLGIP
jgi:hypothetical protein